MTTLYLIYDSTSITIKHTFDHHSSVAEELSYNLYIIHYCAKLLTVQAAW